MRPAPNVEKCLKQNQEIDSFKVTWVKMTMVYPSAENDDLEGWKIFWEYLVLLRWYTFYNWDKY